MKEFFARGKASLAILQHPLTHLVDLDRMHAAALDRCGADGRTLNKIKERCNIPSTQRSKGLALWANLSEEMHVTAIFDVYNEFDDDVNTAWADAQLLFDDDELKPSRSTGMQSIPTMTITSSTSSGRPCRRCWQEVLAAQQLLGNSR